jgi:predicted nucleic acid-binding protein
VILVDSSVWIDYFRDADTAQVILLDSLLGRTPLAVGDLIAAEVLQGVRDEKEFRWVKKALDAFDHVDLGGYELAVRASENYRLLRTKGITIRKTVDTIIATRCIEDGLTLLHADRDFEPFVEHLGLKVAYAEAASET